jgi:hypothetical protein
MKIVINCCFGGFSLNRKARQEYCTRKGIENISDYDIVRSDPDLVAVVESMGKSSWGKHAELKIVEVPDEVKWTVEEYDGVEWVAEVHRTWR